MRIMIALLTLTLLSGAKSPFAGTWEGKINGLPGIDLTIEDAGGKISGVVGFYFQLRGDDGKWRVADKYTVPLLAPRVEGRTLEFEMIHHKRHGSDELGPNAKFRLELSGADEASLRKLEDRPDGGPGLKLIRTR